MEESGRRCKSQHLLVGTETIMEYSDYIQAEYLPNTSRKISVNYNTFQTVIYPVSGDDKFETINNGLPLVPLLQTKVECIGEVRLKETVKRN